MAKNEVSVYFSVSSKTLTLSELSGVLGRPSARLSFDKESTLGVGPLGSRKYGESLWRISSNLSEARPIASHLRALTRKAATISKLAKSHFGDRVKTSLEFAVFIRSAHASLCIDRCDVAKIFGEIDTLEVFAYPCSD